MALITAAEARKMANSLDVDVKLAPLVEDAVSKICHAVRHAASDGEFKITYELPDHLFSRVDVRLQDMGFGSRKAFWYWKPGWVKVVVTW